MVILSGCFSSISGNTQSVASFMFKGNEAYKNKIWEEAEKSYNMANQKKATFTGEYNEANALYQQNKYKEAAEMNMSALGKAETDAQRAMANYNLGNSFYKSADYAKAIDAYKQSLRLNPSDLDAKKNLTKALQKKKEQDQQKNQQQNKKEEEQKQKEQSTQNKDKEQKNEKGQEGNEDGQQKPPEDQKDAKESNGKPQNLSKQESENMLRIMKQEEQATRARLMKQQRPQQGNSGKDW